MFDGKKKKVICANTATAIILYVTCDCVHGNYPSFLSAVTLFSGSQLSIACSSVLIATESWVVPGNEASCYLHLKLNPLTMNDDYSRHRNLDAYVISWRNPF